MAHLQYMPGDPRLVDQLVYELKSKGIFDQFRKECIADVDTRPAYQNLRQRVENSVAAFLSRQCWKPDLNKNQLREKLRKHILDGNYLEQGVERIVDQVVNPKVASVFIPQVEDLVYNYLGIARKKPTPETSNDKVNDNDLLPTDLEAVSPGSVKSNDDKVESMDEVKDESMDIDQVDKDDKIQVKDDNSAVFETAEKDKIEPSDTQISVVSELTLEPEISIDKSTIPLPDELKAEDIPPPENSPPNIDIDKIELPPKIDVDKIELPKEPDLCLNFSTNPTDIPLPDEGPKSKTESYFKPNNLNSEDEDSSSSDSSLIRNMSPLTPIRNFNNENSCDAQQGFENDSDTKSDDKKEPSSFRFALEAKSPEDSSDKSEKKEAEQSALAYKFDNQVNINTYNTPVYEDSSNSNNLQIDYESDANSKMVEVKPDAENSVDTKKESKVEAKKSVHKSSQSSRDSHRHSSSKDRRSDSKHSNSRDNSRHDKKSSKDDKSKSNKDRERSRDRTDKKDSRDSSKHRSSHKSSNYRDSKTHRSSTSSSRHSSKPDDKKDKSSRNDKSSDRSKDKKDSKSSSSKSEKDKKSNNNNKNEKEKKKEKKDNDDHYSVSGRGNHTRRSTDRDSNDGSSSSKGSNLPSSKNSSSKKESKSSSAKSDNTSTSSESTSPSDKDVVANVESESKASQNKPVVRVENQLEVPISTPPRLPFVPDVTLKKPKFAANLEEAKRFMKMRKFLDEEQKRMNQEAALLLEFQANVRPSLSQVYSSIPGPELEFACVSNPVVLESRVMYEIPVANTNIIEPVVPTGKVINAITYEIPRTDSIVQNEVQDTNIVNILLVTPKIDIEQPVKIVSDSIDEPCHDTQEIDTDRNLAQEADVIDVGSHIETKVNSSETYNENKPFSQLVDEISEYSKASEKLRNEKTTTKAEIDDISKPNTSEEVNKKVKEFEVTIITEEISESEDFDKDKTEITLPEDIKDLNEIPLQYFAEHEKYDAEISRLQFGTFFKDYVEKTTVCNKLYLVNCDTYEESVIKDVLKDFGEYEIVNYYKNGHLKLPKKNKNIVKDVNLSSEISLPVDNNEISNIEVEIHSPVFSPVKSDCSFELTSDYTAKLEEMVNKTSRQQVMEIILGSLIEQSTDEMPKIDYCMDVSIEENNGLKRKMEVESTENNNSCVLTPTKLRKLSDSDQISSTTEEADEFTNNNKIPNNGRSRYLGRARRVGLPRPRKTNPSNSPSSDKSVENYEQNTQTPPQTPNGKIRTPQRKVQRYDTSDLYKPKLHYLSRRNNVT